MTSKVSMALIVLVVLATALLMGSVAIRSDDNATQPGVCSQAKACPLASTLPCCEAKKEAGTCPALKDPEACPAVCPEASCPKANEITACPAGYEKPCCDMK